MMSPNATGEGSAAAGSPSHSIFNIFGKSQDADDSNASQLHSSDSLALAAELRAIAVAIAQQRTLLNERFDKIEARLDQVELSQPSVHSFTGGHQDMRYTRPIPSDLSIPGPHSSLATPLTEAEETGHMDPDRNRERIAMAKQENFLQKFAHEEVYGKTKQQFDEEAAEDNKRMRAAASHTFGAHAMLIPSSVTRLTWDACSMLLVLFIAVTLPFRVAFNSDCPSSEFAISDMAIDIFFITDIIINFRTAYVHDGEVRTAHGTFAAPTETRTSKHSSSQTNL
jgi:hypothetical protein